jgi:hypothetical protein
MDGMSVSEPLLPEYDHGIRTIVKEGYEWAKKGPAFAGPSVYD